MPSSTRRQPRLWRVTSAGGCGPTSTPANARAVMALPTPAGPVKSHALGTRSARAAFISAVMARSWAWMCDSGIWGRS